MQFLHPLNKFCETPISEWTAASVYKLPRPLRDQLGEVVNAMGVASAKAQELPTVITEINKFMHSDNTLYLALEGTGTVMGILKVGHKNLFVRDSNGGLHECAHSLCVLDFYVSESRQRQGIGKALMDRFLSTYLSVASGGSGGEVQPERVAYDRPSKKLIGFLAKNYGLTQPLLQTNNFVVFKPFFDFLSNQKGSTPVPGRNRNSIAYGAAAGGGVAAAGSKTSANPAAAAAGGGMAGVMSATAPPNQASTPNRRASLPPSASPFTNKPQPPQRASAVPRKYPNSRSDVPPFGLYPFAMAGDSAITAPPQQPPHQFQPQQKEQPSAAAGAGAAGASSGPVLHPFVHHSSNIAQLRTKAIHARHDSQPHSYTTTGDYHAYQYPTDYEQQIAAAGSQSERQLAQEVQQFAQTKRAQQLNQTNANAAAGAGAGGAAGAGYGTAGRFASRDPDYVSPLYVHSVVADPKKYPALSEEQSQSARMPYQHYSHPFHPSTATVPINPTTGPTPLSPQQRQQRFSKLEQPKPQPQSTQQQQQPQQPPQPKGSAAPAAGANRPTPAVPVGSISYPHPTAGAFNRELSARDKQSTMSDVFAPPPVNTDTESTLAVHRPPTIGPNPPSGFQPQSPNGGLGIGGARKKRLSDFSPLNQKDKPPTPSRGVNQELQSIDQSIIQLRQNILQKQSQLLSGYPKQSYDVRTTGIGGFSKGAVRDQFEAATAASPVPPAVAAAATGGVSRNGPISTYVTGQASGAAAAQQTRGVYDRYGVAPPQNWPQKYTYQATATAPPPAAYQYSGAASAGGGGGGGGGNFAAAEDQPIGISAPTNGGGGGGGGAVNDEYYDADPSVPSVAVPANGPTSHRVRTADATSLPIHPRPFHPPAPVHFTRREQAPTPPHHYSVPDSEYGAVDKYVHRSKPVLEPQASTQAYQEFAPNVFRNTLRH